MSEEKENDVAPAILPESEAAISEEKVDEPEVVVDEVLASKPEVEESLVAEVAEESGEESVVEGDSDVVVEPTSNVVSSAEPTKRPKSRPSVTNVNNTISSATAEPTSVKKSEGKKAETVAVFSEKNARSNAIGGSIYRGYNLFPRKVADKWLEHAFVRPATPEEVARIYG
jgi:hypothetical protein